MSDCNVTPTGEYSIPIVAIHDMLADVTAWQSWVGAPSAAEAKKSIHLVAFDSETKKQPTGTFAYIYTDDDWEAEAIAGGASDVFLIKRTVVLAIEADTPAEYADAPKDARVDFLNHTGAVVSGLMELSGRGGYVSIERFMFAEAPWRSEVHRAVNEGDRQGIAWRISWGL